MKRKKVIKHNKLNNAAIKLNGSDYKVYLNAIALIKKNQSEDSIAKCCELSAKEFSIAMKIDQDNAYKILKSTADKLVKNQIVIEKPESDEIQIINIVDTAIYNKKKGTIKIEFTHGLIQYLKTNDTNYTMYYLAEIADLTSIYAIRLYELIQQYKQTGYISRSIEQLRKMFGIADGEYSLYADFKRKVIGQAIKEISHKTKFNVDIVEIKDGKKVVKLEFYFNKMIRFEGIDKSGNNRVIFRHTKKVLQPELI